MWLKITKVADCIVLHTTCASLGISGPWQHKTSKFPRERLQMGVADRAIVLKETVAHFWVLHLENSGAQGPPARFRSGRSCHPPGWTIASSRPVTQRAFETSGNLLRKFRLFICHDSETNRNQGRSLNEQDFLQFKMVFFAVWALEKRLSNTMGKLLMPQITQNQAKVKKTTRMGGYSVGTKEVQVEASWQHDGGRICISPKTH